MALGTQSGSLLIKDGALQQGCACCQEPPCPECCADQKLPRELSARLQVTEVTACYVDRFLFGGTLFFCAREDQFAIDETVSLVLVENSPSCAEWLHDSCDGITRVRVQVVLVKSGSDCSWSASWLIQKCVGNGVFTAGGPDKCCGGSKGFVIIQPNNQALAFSSVGQSVSLPTLLNECQGQATASGDVAIGFDCTDALQQSLGAVCLAQEQCGGDSNINSSQCDGVLTPWSLEITV